MTDLNPNSLGLVRHLVSDAKSRGLVIFVGSGVNSNCVPLWSELLGKLLEQSIKEASFEDSRVAGLAVPLSDWCKANFDMCAQASLVKRLLGAERFRIEIQKALYPQENEIETKVKKYCANRKDNPDQPKEENFELLRTVAELCSLPQIRAVATFNFDTLLECAIEAWGVKRPRPFFGQKTFGADTALDKILPVYHVHGLLSPLNSLLPNVNESAMLAYDEYFDMNADPLSWETSTSLHLLRHYCTFWVGSSLRDWNMVRLLASADSGPNEHRAYCIQSLEGITRQKALSVPTADKLDDFAGSNKGESRRNFEKRELDQNSRGFEEVAMRFRATMFDAIGMDLIVAGPRYSHIPEVIQNYITKPLKADPRQQAAKA